MTIYLQINAHMTSHQIAFPDHSSAQEQLDLLRPKMRGTYSMRRNGEESETHTIKAPSGDVVVVLDKIEVARIVDTEIHDALVNDHQESLDNRKIAMEVKLSRALAAAKAGSPETEETTS